MILNNPIVLSIAYFLAPGAVYYYLSSKQRTIKKSMTWIIPGVWCAIVFLIVFGVNLHLGIASVSDSYPAVLWVIAGKIFLDKRVTKLENNEKRIKKRG